MLFGCYVAYDYYGGGWDFYFKKPETLPTVAGKSSTEAVKRLPEGRLLMSDGSIERDPNWVPQTAAEELRAQLEANVAQHAAEEAELAARREAGART